MRKSQKSFKKQLLIFRILKTDEDDKENGPLGGCWMIPVWTKLMMEWLKWKDQLKKLGNDWFNRGKNKPELLAQPTRRRRVASGSGISQQTLIRSCGFQRMRGLMKQMSTGGGLPGMEGGLPGMSSQGPNPYQPRKGRGRFCTRRQRPVKKKKGFGDL